MTINGRIWAQEIRFSLCGDVGLTSPCAWEGFLTVDLPPGSELSYGDVVVATVMECTEARQRRQIDALVALVVEGLDSMTAVLEWMPTGYPDFDARGGVKIEIVAKEVIG